MTKIIQTIKALASRVLEIEKRSGLYVYRPVLNGQAWHDWAVKYGVPKPLAADDLRVTVLYSSVDVKMPIDEQPMSIDIYSSYDPGCFALLGPKEESLCWVFDSWTLWSRNAAFISNGAKSTYPTYRPHMTLTNDVGAYELPDEALRNMPRHIILGGEINSDIKAPDQTDEDPDGVEADDAGRTLVVVIELAAKEAQKALDDETAEINVLDRIALRDIAAQKAITKGVAKRIAAEPWATDALKALVETPVKKGGSHTEEREITMTVRELPEDMRKSCEAANVFKNSEEQRLIWGWASVATIKGVPVVDLEGDTITVGAQREWLHSLMKGQRGGTFEHQGAHCNEVVEGIVLDHDLQKALGIDLGMEGVLTCTHVPADEDWAKVREGNWMHSIAGTVLVEVED